MKFDSIFPATLVGVSIVLVQPQIARALSSAEVAQIAQAITVKIESPNGVDNGSGIIIKKDGDTYYVLTAFHVVSEPGKYTLIAPDEQQYQIDYQTVKQGERVDLAVLQFTSSKTYKIAKIGNSDNSTLGTVSYVAGFPKPTAAFSVSTLRFLIGNITANASRPVDDGYQIAYSNNTLPGMSGGPVFNDRGEVIAVHGRAETVANRDQDNPKPISTGNNLGIPINTFLRLAMVDVGVTPPAPVVATAPKADDFFLQANDKYDKGNYQGAIEDYTKAIEINPKFVEAYNNRGNAYLNSANKLKAIADYDRAITLNSNFADAYKNRGYAYSRLGNYRQSISDYDRAIAINPKYREAYYLRGMSYFLLKKYEQAISSFNQALALKSEDRNAFPKDLDIYSFRADIYYKLRKYQLALSDYNQLLAVDDSRDTLYLRSLTYYELKQTKAAIQDWMKIAEIKDLNTFNYRDGYSTIATESILALAVALYTQGDREIGLRLGEQWLTVNKTGFELERLGWHQRLQRDAAKFLKHPRIRSVLEDKTI